MCYNSCCSRCYTYLGIAEEDNARNIGFCRNNICFPCFLNLQNLLSTKKNETINEMCDLCFETFDCYIVFDKTFSKNYICIKCAKKISL